MPATDIATTNIACIKWGTKFPAYYVNRLYAGVEKHLDRPFRFFCMTDDATDIREEVEIVPLPAEPYTSAVTKALEVSKRKGAFGKVSLFRKGALDCTGPILGFDLDVVITGPLGDLMDFAPGKICMRHDWLAARRGRPDGHGSVFRFDPALHEYLYTELASDPAGWVEKSNFSEQQYTSLLGRERGDFEYFPNDWIASFKRNAMRMPPLNHFLPPKLPEDTRVMCFHGKPKMEEALEGYKGGFTRSTLPAEWLQREWVGEG